MNTAIFLDPTPPPPAPPATVYRQTLKDWLRDLPARTAFKITRLPPVSRILASGYQKAVLRHREHLPLMSGIDRTIVEALARDGFYMASLDDLGLSGGRETLRIAQILSGQFAQEARDLAAAGTVFTMVPPERIVGNPDIFSWGLSDRLLDLAEAYLGVPAAYDGMQIIYTVADGREISTRRWHRDWEDRKMLKIAIYLNDVDGEGGPLEAVVGPPRHGGDPYDYGLMSDQELRQAFGDRFDDLVKSCTGKTGTVIFIDTARHYHRGRPATGSDRAAIFYSYFARTPRHPFFCERSGLSRSQIRRLSRNLAPRQRAAALWRRKLPAWVRLIPSARV